MEHLFLESHGSKIFPGVPALECLKPHLGNILLVKVSHQTHLRPKDREIDPIS